jgi:hypothetical protein
MSLGNVIWLICTIVALTLGTFMGNQSGRGNPKFETVPEGVNIEFLYVGEENTFLAKVGESSAIYYNYKFSGEQPKVGKYRIVGVGSDRRELLPLTETSK